MIEGTWGEGMSRRRGRHRGEPQVNSASTPYIIEVNS